jgi:ArsR family transcriptional regulator
MIAEDQMKEFITVMKALSDPSRVKILKMLEQRPLCVCEITAALGLAQPTVSKHLKVLEGAGLVAFEKDGQWVNYRLEDRRRNPYAHNLLKDLGGWLNEDGETVSLLFGLRSISRESLCR